MRKLLKDYPVKTRIEAAGGCQYCGAKYEVVITFVDESGCFGDVEYSVRHREDCPEGLDEEEGRWHEVQSGSDVAGWEYMDKPVKFFGLEFYPLKSRVNVGPCLICGKLVIGVPLILFLNQGRKGELDFCFPCVQEYGMLDALIGAHK